MTHAERVTQGLRLLARKAVCQASHVTWMQKQTGCTDEQAEAELSKRLRGDVIPFNAKIAAEIVAPDVRRVMKRKP